MTVITKLFADKFYNGELRCKPNIRRNVFVDVTNPKLDYAPM